jgi:hypothetical protein
MFRPRPGWEGCEVFWAGNYARRGETNAPYLLGRYFIQGRGTHVGWAMFPVGVGLTEQGLKVAWG